MKLPIALAFAGSLLFTSCTKKYIATPEAETAAPSFTEYSIKQGNQFCDKNVFTNVSLSSMKFIARFDSTAIYQTANSGNQSDINKLYGFADNNSDHHMYSARFGWRWKNNSLNLFAYIYNEGIMSFKDLGPVQIGQDINCGITVNKDDYVFELNGVFTTMPRSSTTRTAIGYKLYPYFGGDELAPHDIHIWIKDL